YRSGCLVAGLGLAFGRLPGLAAGRLPGVAPGRLDGLIPSRGLAYDPELGGGAGPAYMRVVLEVLWGGDFDGQPGSQLDPVGLVQELLVTRGWGSLAATVTSP